MKRFTLIIGLLVVLSGLVRPVDAATNAVGYGSNGAGEIHLINLESATSISSFSTGIPFQGLAIDTFGTTLYGSDQNGKLYSIDIATETTTEIGEMGYLNESGNFVALGTIEAMDFNINGTELWVTDFVNFPTVSIYSINTSDASATLVQTLHPPGFINDVVRAMSANTTKDVWIANDKFPSMDFQSIDTDVSHPGTNITHIGFLDDDPGALFFVQRPEIRGMDRAFNGVLYGLSSTGGVYSLDQDPNLDDMTTARLSFIGDTDGQADPILDDVWLSLAVATATTTTIKLDIKPKQCPNELKINVVDDSDSIDGIKVAILGTQDFNVNDIDVTTLTINEISPVANEYMDVTAPTLLEPCNCEVLDPDGIVDLVLSFNKAGLVATLGVVNDLDEIPLTLIGKLTDGVTQIEGSDCVLINTSDVSTDDTDCCDGKVTELTLKYTGSCPVLVKVKQKGDITVFSDTVNPGDTFTFVGADNEGTLGSEILIFKGCRLDTKIHTSCSQPIGPGLVRGDFEVISGTSLNGGALCPVNNEDANDDSSIEHKNKHRGKHRKSRNHGCRYNRD